jgi:nucleoside 2-deoxyribosyltransferase
MACPICTTPGAATLARTGDSTVYKCAGCGEYRIYGSAEAELGTWKEDDRFVLSGVTRTASDRGHPVTLTPPVRKHIESAPVWTSLFDGVDLLMLFAARRSEGYASHIKYSPETDYAAVFARGARQFKDLVLLARDLGWWHDPQLGSVGQITLKGWRRLEELRDKQPTSRQAFVAMSFADELQSAYDDGLKPGIEDTSYYKAFRVDRTEHNEKIDDYIIASIRKCGLLVADFTDQRAGVYFEAGFAHGLGIPVVWTCKDGQSKDLHFDTRQYNHILWTEPAELRTKLHARLTALYVPREHL